MLSQYDCDNIFVDIYACMADMCRACCLLIGSCHVNKCQRHNLLLNRSLLRGVVWSCDRTYLPTR